MRRLLNVLIGISMASLLFVGCGPRQFAIRPEMFSHEFTVVEKFGKMVYTPVVDARNELDRKGEKPGACGGGPSEGTLILGDENYQNPLLQEVDKHLKASMLETGLFTSIVYDSDPDASYTFKCTLDQFHAVLNESKAQNTQACIGGLLGAMIASAVDVEAATDIQLTGILFSGQAEIWRKSATKHVTKTDDYSNTKKNLEKSMGEAIGSCSKELIASMAIFLSSK